MLASVIDQLGQKELEIALFYLRQGQQFGARLHLANVVILFPDTPAGRRAKEIMSEKDWDTSLHSVSSLESRDSMRFLE